MRLANNGFLRNWRLSRGWDQGNLLGSEVEAEFGSLALERSQFPLPLLAFITFRADVFKRYFILEHKVDGASDLVGSSDQLSVLRVRERSTLPLEMSL